MASTMLSIRNSNLSTFNAVAINYSTLSGTTTILTSTMVSIGVGNNKTYSTLSQGNFTSTSNWVTSLSGRSSTIGVSMSANAQTQLVVSQSSISTSVQYTSTLGTQWASLSGASGLPNSLQTSYSAGAISGDGMYGVLGTTTGELFVTSNAGQTFSGLNTASPAIYLPLDTVPANGSSSSGTAPTTLTVVGPPTQAPSFVIGSGAINLANTPGSGNATQYIRGSWTVPANFAVRLWFNMQSPPTSNIEFLFSTGTVANGNDTILYIDTARRLVLKIPGGVTIYSSLIVTVNTWYNVFFTIQSNGACSLYANNIVVGTGTSTATALSTGNFGIGTYDAGGASLLNPFAGYIDDIKIYNTTIPFTNQFPSQPFTTLAVSNSGQYMLAAMANQGLYMSSNYGSTWSQVTSAMLYAAWTTTQVSATGQYMLANSPIVNVQPQLAGLTGSTTVVNASTTWQVNGVTWTSSASSAASATNNSYLLFNNTVDYWVSALGSYNGAGVNNGTKSTVVIGQGTVTGEYVQLQSSVSIQLYSYTFTSGDYRQYPKTLTFAGSNDGVTWYLLQSVTMSGNPVGTAGGSTSTSYIIINQSGAQPMITSSGSATFTCTTSQYSANPYTYVRMIIPSVFGDSGFTALAELFLRFTAGGQTYSTNYGSTWNAALPLYSMIQPQLTGLASSGTNLTTSPWQANGVSWIAKASSLDPNNPATWPVSGPFDGVSSTQWNSNIYYNTLGNYTGPNNTTVSGSTVSGEWLQIKSSIPLIIYSYQLGVGTWFQYPKTYTIAGSNDESTWFAIQTVVLASNPFGTTNQIIPFSPIIVNQNGLQTVNTSAGSTVATCTAYNSTTPYTYFRLIGTSIIGNGTTQELAIGEFIINFTTGVQTTQSLSPSGLTALTGYIPSTIAPQKTGLTTNTWNRGDVAWAASASSLFTSNFPPWAAFNNIANASTATYSWASAFNYLSGTGYNNTYSTIISQSGGAITSPNYGEWLQIQSSIPLIMSSYNFGCGNTLNVPKTYVIAGSLDGTTWFPLQSVNMGSTNPFTTNFTSAISGPIMINGPTSQIMNGGFSATLSCTNYTTSITAYSYFRIIVNSVYGTTDNPIELTEWFINFTTPSNTSLYNVVSPLTNLSTGSSAASGIILGIIIGSAVSNTGQYMVVITNNTIGNNVYYSTNTGATFTGLQLGSSPMTSCAISYDGSYITVSNATTVYTLNNNSTGYTVAIGNQAGAVNQYQNAIAIGNYAGNYYQYSNSIILNATGQPLNSANQGFYVAPIAQYTASSSQTFSLLGYGLDNQIVQTGMTYTNGTLSGLSGLFVINGPSQFIGNNTLSSSNGSIAVGQNSINAYFGTMGSGFGGGIMIYDYAVTAINIGWQNCMNIIGRRIDATYGGYISYGCLSDSFGIGFGSVNGPLQTPTTSTEKMCIMNNGNVGIGITTPTSKLHINGNINQIQTAYASSSTLSITTGAYGSVSIGSYPAGYYSIYYYCTTNNSIHATAVLMIQQPYYTLTVTSTISNAIISFFGSSASGFNIGDILNTTSTNVLLSFYNNQGSTLTFVYAIYKMS
jgi:hypothetical protein